VAAYGEFLMAAVNDGDNTKSDRVDGAIGEESQFHQTFGYYGQGVSIATAVLPDGWEDRLVEFIPIDSEPARSMCLDPADLVVAKLVAGRGKDLSYAAALVASGHVDVEVLKERTDKLHVVGAIQRRVMGYIERLDRSDS
jgi:Nucleotidyltransferase of unknown function (DUF6036)